MSHLHSPLIAMLLLLAGCQTPNPRVASKVNSEAAIIGIPMNPLQWKVITSGVNRQNATMFSLFGNNPAIEHARTRVKQTYPVGSRLFLVTWHSRENMRWFGGRIPAAPKTVEALAIRDSGKGEVEPSYSRYEGAPLKESILDVDLAKTRIAYLLSLRAAVMP